jgi:hypothetical protein
VAAAEPDDAVESAASPVRSRGLPDRPPADRPASQAAGAADHRSADPLCQRLSGSALDEWITARVLVAVEPAALVASLEAVADVERERADLSRHGQLRRERVAQEVDRAARQYQACEPENRLVGRELERRWEESLKSRRQIEEEYERW